MAPVIQVSEGRFFNYRDGIPRSSDGSSGFEVSELQPKATALSTLLSEAEMATPWACLRSSAVLVSVMAWAGSLDVNLSDLTR